LVGEVVMSFWVVFSGAWARDGEWAQP